MSSPEPAVEPEPKPEPGRPSVLPILGVHFIGTLGYSLILPFLVFLVTRLGGNALVYGLLGATYPTFQLLGAPVLGRWSDRFGRKRVLLLSQAGTLLAWSVFAGALFLPAEVLFEGRALVLTLPVAVMFLARALDGLTGGNVSVANAYLADLTDDEHRSADFGRMAISTNLGFIAGPLLAGLLGATRMGELLPVLAAVAISALGTVLILRLREPDPCQDPIGPRSSAVRTVLGQEPSDCMEARAAAQLPWGELVRLPGVGYLLVLYFLIFLGFNFFYTAFPVHAVQGLEWTLPQVGTFFAALSVMMVVVQGPVLSRLSRRVPEGLLIVAGCAVLGLGFVLLAGGQLASILAGTALIAAGNGVMWPSVMALIAQRAGRRHQGAVQGVAGAAGSLASILGLVSGGWLYGSIGSATFLVSAGTLGLVTLLALRLVRRPVGAIGAAG